MQPPAAATFSRAAPRGHGRQARRRSPSASGLRGHHRRRVAPVAFGAAVENKFCRADYIPTLCDRVIGGVEQRAEAIWDFFLQGRTGDSPVVQQRRVIAWKRSIAWATRSSCLASSTTHPKSKGPAPTAPVSSQGRHWVSGPKRKSLRCRAVRRHFDRGAA